MPPAASWRNCSSHAACSGGMNLLRRILPTEICGSHCWWMHSATSSAQSAGVWQLNSPRILWATSVPCPYRAPVCWPTGRADNAPGFSPCLTPYYVFLNIRASEVLLSLRESQLPIFFKGFQHSLLQWKAWKHGVSTCWSLKKKFKKNLNNQKF